MTANSPTAGPPPSPAVWVVLVDYNGLADTRTCLRSLAASVAPVSVVVVDNASKEDVAAGLAGEFPWAHVVRSAVNGGWAGGNNRGVEFALARGAELLILLNNDTTVRPDFVRRMSAAAAAHPAFGVLGPVIRYMDEPDQVQTMGVAFNRPGSGGFFGVVDVTPDPPDVNPPRVVEVDVVNGCCLMIRRDVVERIGKIDEAFFLVHEESDWCLRAQAAGFECGVIADGPVYHKGSSSFAREGKPLQRYYDARNLRLLLRKHRGRRGRRGRLGGFAAYLRYVFHRYAHARAAGSAAVADAIVEGVYDAFAGRYGPRTERPRWGLGVLRRLFAAAWRVKG